MTINHRRRSFPRNHVNKLPALIELWLLRLLVPLGCHREFINQHSFDNDAIAEAIGLEAWIDPCSYDFDPKAVRAALKQRHLDAERKLSKAKAPSELSGNIERLAK